MSGNQGDRLVFGRYTREECGLPPAGSRLGEPALTPLRILLLLVALAAAGWLAGKAMARWRAMWLFGLPAQVAFASPDERPGLLFKGKVYAAAFPEQRGMRRSLALAALMAAERSPRRLGYYANAANLMRNGGDGQEHPALRFAMEVTAAGVFAELDDYARVFEALTRAEAALEEMPDGADKRGNRLLLINAQAYFLACANRMEGGDPEKALELAQLVIASRDPLPGGGYASGEAAFLDTLAMARFANGDRAGAVSAQTLALGLADAQSLDVYVRHYDEFFRGNNNVQ